MLIAGIIRGFNGVVLLSYLLLVLLQPLKIVFATLVVQLSGATEVALLLTRPNFNTGKTYNYKGLPFVN